MPTGLGFDPQFPAIATSGSFTFSNAAGDFEHTTGTLTYRYSSKAKAIAGPLGAPQMARGDWVLVMNWVGRSGTQQSVAGWALSQVDLAAGQLTSPATAPTWQSGDITYSNICTTDPSKCMPTFNAGATKARVEGALGTRKVASVDFMMYGISPSLGLPGFVPGGPPSYLDAPLIIPFVQSSSQDSSMIVCDPSGALPFARVMYSGIMNSRTVNGVTLTSALQSVSNVFMGPMSYPAPLVRTFDLEGISLAGDTDDVSVPVSSSMRELRLMTEADQTADDFVVALYEITNSTLAPVRIYHVLVGSVMIDGNLLASGHTYVLGVTTRHGLPGAFRGDYREVAYPFGIATTFSRTFKIQ
jgi:hypothetical protein